MTQPTISRFGFGTADGDASQKEMLGGKGANLAEMAKLGLPIPPGVTIPTHWCNEFENAKFEDGTGVHVVAILRHEALKHFDEVIVPKFGYMPLLSVRSGARVSMPGMMDTILNVGLTSQNLPEWKKRIGEHAALDSYRRLIQMYGCTVNGLEHSVFEQLLTTIKAMAKVKTDAELGVADMQSVVDSFRIAYMKHVGEEFPDTLEEQLHGCIGAVFSSWHNERAIEYRIANKIPHSWGTAVTVQSMVFGNMNDHSATGVLFTRDPNTGAKGLFGEFLVNAQGEDVVAGIRTPEPLGGMESWNTTVYDKLIALAEQMEAHNRDMQDMEFTVQDGQLFILQTRSGKRSARAAFKIAHDLVEEGLIQWPDAVKRVTGKQFMALKRPTIAPGFKTVPTVTGLPAAGSVVTGVAVLTAEAAKQSKVPCVLVTNETTPDDFGGMMAAVGILTRTGGATSHAAVVARGMDKCCVVGAHDMVIGQTITIGDKVTLDGATGRVWVNVDVPVQAGGITPEANRIAQIALQSATHAEGKALRIELDPNAWEMQLPPEGYVVFDVSALAGAKRGRRYIRQLLTELETRKGLHGMLEFVPSAVAAHPDDFEILEFLGAPSALVHTQGLNVDKIGQALGYAKWTKALTKRWVVSAPGELLAVAEERGFGIARTAHTLGELMAGGAVEVAPLLVDTLKKQGVPLAVFLDLLKNAGTVVTSIPKAVDADTLMFTVLGK